MTQPAIFWDPSGFELDSLGAKKYIRATDGDTPYVSVSIRMLSIDTPEVHYPGNKKPSKQDGNLVRRGQIFHCDNYRHNLLQFVNIKDLTP